MVASPDLIWSDRVVRLNWTSVLIVLLLVDLAFVLAHMALWLAHLHAPLNHWLDIQRDRSIPEFFMYGKWVACILACAYCFARHRAPLYFVWSALFAYFLLDDSLQIHERAGRWLTEKLNLEPGFWLRAQDFGELAVSAAAGFLLFGAMAVAYMTADASQSVSRAFSRRQLWWVGVLVFFGVLVDMLHVQIRKLGIRSVTELTGVLEDAGEMTAASILLALCIRQAAILASPSPH